MENNPAVSEEEMLETISRKNFVLRKEQLTRLEKNPDFQAVILEGYLKDNVLRKTSLLANERIKMEGQRPLVIEELIAASSLEQWFYEVHNLGNIAEQEIAENRE